MEDNKTFSTPLVNDYKTYSMELAGRTLSVDIGRVGKQANGCAFMHYGDTPCCVPPQPLTNPERALISSPCLWSTRKKCTL